MRSRRKFVAILSFFGLFTSAAVVLSAAAELAYRVFRDRGCQTSVDGDFELYVVGESTAVGEPYNDVITPARLVSARFENRIGGKDIRPIILAHSGESIYPQSVALERALRCRDGRNPGAVLIYSGHNDAGGTREMSVFERLSERVFARSALLADFIFYVEKNDYIGRERTFDAWQYYLRRVVDMSRRSGLVPILATAASNLAGVDPGLGIDDSLPGTKAMLARGEELESKRSYSRALDYYSEQSVLPARLGSYLKYRMGKCLEAMGQYALARRDYQEAADAGDSWNFGRATSAQNDYIRRLAVSESIPLVDTVDLFARHSPHGIVGDELFSDGHHPNVRGYVLLSSAYAERLSEAFHEPLRRSIASPADALRLFPMSKQEKAMAYLRSGCWFFSVAARHANPKLRLTQALDRYERAVALAPDDFYAWLWMGLTQAALKTDLLSKPEDLDWMSRHHLFYFDGKQAVAENELPVITAKLRGAGVSEDILEHIMRSFRVSR